MVTTNTQAQARLFPAVSPMEKDFVNGTQGAVSSMRPPNVLLALPDDAYRNSFAAFLCARGLNVVEADDPAAAMGYIVTENKVDVILISTDLPGLSALDLLARLRNLDASVPVAVLAEDYDQAHEEIALNCGASEFLCRTRRPSIIAKRLCLLAEGVKGPTHLGMSRTGGMRIGPLLLSPRSHRALWRGRRVPLTATEFRIVRLLVCRAGEEIPYREIYDLVHGAGFYAGNGPAGYRTNVRSLIHKIRKKFRSLDKSFDEIRNCPGLGYSWSAPTVTDQSFGESAFEPGQNHGQGRPVNGRSSA